MTQREDVIKFEQGRIKALQEERLHIQKKTFTKWMNSFLQKARMEVEDLFTDLADGKKLLKLLEIISGEKLGKPNNGKMRVHKIENVNKSLAFLHTKVRLESIGAEDIVDGNPRLILGLIWTIILRFQIQEIEIDVDEENESSEKKSAKDALLLWCQRKTTGYPGVAIHDFTGSWRSGLGFNALIHSHRPDLFEFSTLAHQKPVDNLNNAFDIAQRELGIPRLLDAEDVDTNRPDEKSIITYVASYYHTFARMKNEMKSGRRIANIVGQMMDADKMKLQYEELITNLLKWIKEKIIQLEDRNFPNSLEGIQKELLAFKQYRTIEKPPKYKDRSEIEALYFHINTRLKSLNQAIFIPSDGHLVHDLEKAWQTLEGAEHKREVVLRAELLRQERLEQLNYNFERKSVLREGFLKEMIQVLSDPRYGSNLTQVDATVKKHEAISADIMAREERFRDLQGMCDELVRENYHGADRVKKRSTEVMEKWSELLALLEKHKSSLTTMCALMALLREIDTIMSTIKDLEMIFQSEDVGGHLLGVEDLLQKHSLIEMQITVAMGETVRKLTRQCQQHASASSHKETALLQTKIEELNEAYTKLMEKSAARRARLEESRNFYQFVADHEDEEGWVVEKERICTTGISAKDLRQVISLLQKHKLLMDEMRTRQPKCERLVESGKSLVNDSHPKSQDIKARIQSLQQHWEKLIDLSKKRYQQLQDAIEAYQFYTDANEAESWMNEKLALVKSDDYGVDEPSAQALIQRHRDLEGEIKSYNTDIQSLNSQASKLIEAGINTLELSADGDGLLNESGGEVEEWVNETRLVPQEVWEEEVIERMEYRTVNEEKSVPQVKSLYPFSGQGMVMAKGEVMFLLKKTNQDWWSVRKANGQDGFVPANYVKEIEPKIMQVPTRKPEKVRTVQRVKKTKMVKKTVPVKRTIIKKPIVTPKPIDDNQDVEKRLKKINDTYITLQELAKKRHAFLEDAICLYGFYRECDDFEKWIKDKEKLLRADDKSENVETAKRKYEKFLTDLSASSKRVERLDEMVEEFVIKKHSQLEKVRSRQAQIHQQWDHLNWLKAQKEKSLEGASSVELFNRTCEEAKDWMLEKMTQLDSAEVGPDLKTVQSLQRRHQNLERELAPVHEKVNRVNLLANSVQSSYPNEKGNVSNRQQEILELWDKVQNKATDRRSRLENAVGHQIFMNSSKNLLNWMSTVKEALNSDDSARDVATAESLLKNHQELGEDIKTHSDEYKEVCDLGEQLLSRNKSLSEVAERLTRLQTEHATIEKAWQEKRDWLRQCLDLQLLIKEADHIDTITSSHEAFLEFTDLGVSVDEVEALLKRHEDFENTLLAQDDRLKVFSDVANKLIEADHYDSPYIDKRRNQVLERRKKVKEQAAKRRAALLASRNYQDFAADVDDLRSWLSEKLKTAGDESYRDLNNIERKLQKHEAFERELRANEGQLRNVNKGGKTLVSEGNYRSEEVDSLLEDINSQWAGLVQSSMEKGRRLRQASAQHSYNRTMEDARTKLTELQSSLQSNQLGSDLRNCKKLLQEHQVVENDISVWEQKIGDLVALGQEMAHEGHFDADNILKSSKQCQDKFIALQEPAKQRREDLEESLRYHKFGFEVDTELGWIREHLPLASSDTLGTNLHQAQALFKKHKKLEAEIRGHQPMIDKTLAAGCHLIEMDHPEKKQVENLCKKLREAWQELAEVAMARSKKLELSLKAQQFFSEASEVESWLTEHKGVLSSTDYGRDRDSASKLLTKHKAVELELDTYNAIVTEMGHTASSMVSSKHPDSKAITQKQSSIQGQMRDLQKLANARQQRLMESLYRHEFDSESTELESWIRDKMQLATSDDYGQDYEHLQLLQSKFDDLKRNVEAGSERLNQCQELGNKLIANKSPYAEDIETKLQHLSDCWLELVSLLDNREGRLRAAGEIHRFHRDVADALSRIHDKKAALGDDLGRDLNSTLALLRRHEGFENDLVALEAQLQVLVEDASKLQMLYPGSNAALIKEQQQFVVTNWTDLQDKSAYRREMLQASSDWQRFLSQVRDLMSWASGLQATMMTEEKVHDAASAQTLKTEHEAIKAEIEAREENFRLVLELGQELIQSQHYAAQEIQEKFNQLLDERQKLHAAWQQKKVQLDQLIDLHFFLKDAKQIDTLCSTQEVALSNSDFGELVDEVDLQVKKHDAFEKLFQTQEEKVALLNEHGEKLLAQNHIESALIGSKLEHVNKRREHVSKLCVAKKLKLEDALLYAQFKRDVAEAELWIEEKLKKLEVEAQMGEVTNLEDKIKKLQKHQAFQAEITANQDRITAVKDKGETLIKKQHMCSREVETALERLMSLWKNLLEESANRGRGLEEAQDILEFNNHVDKIEAWIRDKEMMVQAGEMGRDYEHCLALQRKLDDVDSDMRVDDSRIRGINSLADKLIRQGRTDDKAVQTRRDAVNNRWRGLQGALSEYRERLGGALEIHQFNRDVSDTQHRVAEKASLMSVEDIGKDLPAVEQLIRKQEALERDMSAIDGKIKEHDVECVRLVSKYPSMAVAIRGKLNEVCEAWREAQGVAQARRAVLGSAHSKHKFISDLKELEIWVTDTVERISSSQLPSNVQEAQALLELHHERKAEIDGRQTTFKALKEEGQKLKCEEDLARLEELRSRLSSAWEERRMRLSQAHQLQAFKQQADFADAWLANKLAYLNNDDLGDSLPAVEELLRKHEAFVKTVEAQLSRVEDAERSGRELVGSGHYASQQITNTLESLQRKKDKLRESTTARAGTLAQSRQLHCFLRNVYEVEGWIMQKQQVALDENYRDGSNLQSKIQKQIAFESELGANKGRVGAVVTEGEALISEGHYATKEIRTKIDELESDWQSLHQTSQTKRERLSQAYQAQLFKRCLEEFSSWIDEVENQVQSEDHGKDLASVANLLKRHTLLENDVTSHQDQANQLRETAAAFARDDHFMGDELHDRAKILIDRYNGLSEPMQIRRDNLEDAMLLYQLMRDIDDEMTWLAEKEPQAASTDLGNSLTSVQSLQKKHQALESEISSREPVISTVGRRASDMVRSSHFASTKIEEAFALLNTQFSHLKDLSSVRRLRLIDALESQMFYAEASEAERWLEEKKPMLLSSDYGRDEESVQMLLKKLEGIGREILAFRNTVGHLAKLSDNLLQRGHFDSNTITAKQAFIESEVTELERLLKKREERLMESRKLYVFLHEAEEVAEWISDQTSIAASEDYGQDVEHVEILIQRFDSVVSGLASSEGRVANCLQTGGALIGEGHPDSDAIETKIKETQQLWEDLKELAHARQEALMGAKQVHVFDRTADETISWIQEKDAAITTDNYGQDLETIQSLVRKHDGFQTDLEAVKDQVESVVEEGGRLAGLFPDAREHIEVKHEEVLESWTTLLEKAEQRRDKLYQAEQIQAYFDQYRELMAWTNEMIAKVTSPELAQDVPGAEALISRHHEHFAEIKSREEAFAHFNHSGQLLIKQGHFLSQDIQEKIRVLDQRKVLLDQTWEKRGVIYELNLDTQMFKRDADLLENWLESRKPVLHDEKLGESIAQVEDLLRRHEDFEKTIQAQEDKFNSLRRITMLEQSFRKQIEAEMMARQAEKERIEKERLEARKRREVQRIADERKQESDRRKISSEMNGGAETHDKASSGLDDREMIVGSGMAEVLSHGSPQISVTLSSPYIGITSPPVSFKDNTYEFPPTCVYPLTKSQSTVDERLLPPESPETKKSSSISAMLGDRLRKDVKRAESMKADPKKPKRTPSFTTRRRTQSFRKLQKFGAEQLEQLPPVEIQGLLDRKHELQSGGKKAPLRSWKSFYTVLCGQLLCFFKDQEDFVDSKAATSPIIIYKATCEKAGDYTKRKHVFRLCCTDGSEFLFLAPSETEMEDWVNKITFHAQLPPSMQLMSYDENNKNSSPSALSRETGGSSAESSKDSTPEVSRRPPIPPRDPPPPIPSRAPVNNDAVRGRPVSLLLNNGNQNIENNLAQQQRKTYSTSDINSPSPDGAPPPLPASSPPAKGRVNSPPVPQRDPWPTDLNSFRHGTVYSNLTHLGKDNALYTNNNQRSATLPGGYHEVNSNDRGDHSDHSESHDTRKDKRQNVLSFFRRKKQAS